MRILSKDKKFVPFWQTPKEMNLFIILCRVQVYLNLNDNFFINIKNMKWSVGNTVPQNKLIKKTNWKDRPYFISEGRQLGAALYLIFSVCCATEPSGQNRMKLQECCNYISKDGLPDKWHNQWTKEIQAAATKLLPGVGEKPGSEHLLEGDLLFLCSYHILL